VKDLFTVKNLAFHAILREFLILADTNNHRYFADLSLSVPVLSFSAPSIKIARRHRLQEERANQKPSKPLFYTS